MKLSVSVPDDLWNQAMRTSPNLNPSGLVQKALTQMVARHAPTAASRPGGTDIQEALRAARAAVQAKADELFAEGYRRVLDQAGRLDFGLLQWWQQVGTERVAMDLGSHYETGEPLPIAAEAIETALGEVVGENWSCLYEPNDWPGPSTALLMGIDLALHDLLEHDLDAAQGGGEES
jgi:hypothetical protein